MSLRNYKDNGLMEVWTLYFEKIAKKCPPLSTNKYLFHNICHQITVTAHQLASRVVWIDVNCRSGIQNAAIPSNPAFAKVDLQPGIGYKALRIYLNSIGCRTCTKMTRECYYQRYTWYDSIKNKNLQEIAIKVKYHPNSI